MPLKPGDSLERYTILGLLGEGGMGQVYRARDSRLQRTVALKVLHDVLQGEGDEALTTTGGGQRILREARAAASLAHPNVVAIHDVGETEDAEGKRVAYLAMELVDGKSLRACIREGTLPIEERVRIAGDVARALQAAHAIGLVHRDVKPENVMIREDGAVKVLDFGIARRAYAQVDRTSTTEAQILSTLTSQGMRVGTPYYMSPEQMRCEPLDGRSDQFAWGVVAWELLAGKAPWGEAIDALLLVSSVLSKMPERLDAVDPRIPARVADVVERALRKTPRERFASMGELLAALDARGTTPSESAPAGSAPPPVSEEAPRPTSPPAGDAVEGRRSGGARGLRTLLLAGAGVALAFGLLAAMRGLRAPVTPPVDAATGPRCSAKACTQLNGGAPSRCRADGRCAVLGSEDCEAHADPVALESDDTVWFGAMFSKDDPNDDGAAEMHAVDLARLDFAQMMSGFARPGESHAHPFGLVACDDGKDPMRAARHLVEGVGVPAIIGFRNAAELIDVGSALLVPNGVLGMVSVSTSPLVTRLPNRPGAPRVIWRTTTSSAEPAKALGHILGEMIEPQVRASAGVRAASPIRVAYIRPIVRGGTTFDELLLNYLRFNGKSALENEANYRLFVLDESDPKKTPAESQSVARRLLEFAPHVIVYGASPLTIEPMLMSLESAWPSGNPRPRYLFGGTFPTTLLTWIGTSVERRRRVTGLQLVSTPVNGRFVMHYNETAAVPATRTDSPNSSYDAFYLLAYATYALGANPVTGASLSQAIGRLMPPGKPIDVGPAAIFDAYSALRRGERIDLNGATGSLDFDLATGEAPFDQSVLCIDVDASGRAVSGVESGVVFRSEKGTLEGTPRCP